MTTDRELLELAAKAVNGGAWHPLTHDTPNGVWNPLTDDGDALRLAVKLRIEVEAGWMVFSEDPYAATRRAIVRAAAEIGRMMK